MSRSRRRSPGAGSSAATSCSSSRSGAASPGARRSCGGEKDKTRREIGRVGATRVSLRPPSVQASLTVPATMTTAFLFPGQGSQAVGMGKAFYEMSAGAKAIFEEANDAVGFDLMRLAFEGPEAELALTANTQPAVLTASVAAATACAARGLRPALAAGHSLGEYTALVVAGAVRFSDAVRIVRKRGEFMQEAVPVGTGAMAAIMGLELPAVERICADAAQGDVAEIANVNSALQIVIAGHRAAVERAVALATERGGKMSVMLPVSAPFHCSLMAPAGTRLAPEVDAGLAEDGAAVVVSGRDGERLQRTVREWETQGRAVLGVVADAASREDCERLVSTAKQHFGRIDVLVNNAGVTHDQLLVRMTDEDWDRVIEVNLRSAFLMTRAVSKALVRQKSGGRVINITSTAGAMGNAGQVNYSAAKAGLIGFTKAAARELAHWSILVNAVAPGLIETDMTAK